MFAKFGDLCSRHPYAPAYAPVLVAPVPTNCPIHWDRLPPPLECPVQGSLEGLSPLGSPLSGDSGWLVVTSFLFLLKLEGYVDDHVLLAADVAGVPHALEDLVGWHAVALRRPLGMEQE